MVNYINNIMEEDIVRDLQNLWDAVDMADPTKAFAQKVSADIQTQTGKTNNAAKIDPKATLNKAITNAAQKDPVAASDALNATTKPGTAGMKKKMKKEHFQTLAEYMNKDEKKAERLKELDTIYDSLHKQPAKSQPGEKWFWKYGKRGATIDKGTNDV